MRNLIYCFFFLSLFANFSCKKDPVFNTNSSVKLTFSLDTIIFDTVFTSIGSATYQLKVYNPEKDLINISTIKLAKGVGSAYRINVDGTSGPLVKDVEIRGNDSVFIFVEVTIDPGNTNNPFIVQDSILFEINGNMQDVDLVAWGQNAHYITPSTYWEGFPPFSILGCDTVWTDNLPHVVYGYAVVDSTCSLTIEAGTKIYFHNNSGLWIYKGASIKVNGTKESPVYFQGDRLDPYYKDQAGSWSRIWINEGSVNNEFNYAIIKNGFIGIQAETFDQPMGNQLILNNTKIENMSGIGLLARRYTISGSNSVISNCGQYAIALTLGGSYDFTHCTVANYWPYSRKTPSVIITNHYKDPYDNLYLANLDKADFNNCIIYGNQENEILNDAISGADFNSSINYTLLKTNQGFIGTSIFANTDPGFVDSQKGDFRIIGSSFVINKGNPAYINSSTILDLNANTRDANPDLGAYEFAP